MRINLIRQLNPISSSLASPNLTPSFLFTSPFYSTRTRFSFSSRFMSTIQYPTTRRDDTVIDDLHGISVSDPYRWLENPDAPDVEQWVTQQNQVTQSYLSNASSLKPRFHSTVENLMNYDSFSSAWKRGKYWYYSHLVGLANQAVIMQTTGLDDQPRVFLDPNKMSEDGTASLGTCKWSPCGNYVAYGLQRGGSDWEEIYVMECDTLNVLDYSLEWAKFTSIAWTHDTLGFYYARYPTPNSLQGVDDKLKRGAETDKVEDQMIYYHKVGTTQTDDRLVYHDSAHPQRMYSVRVTLDGRYLLVMVNEDCSPKNQVWYVDLSQSFGNEQQAVQKLIDQTYDSSFTYVANDDHIFTFLTNWNAPKNRVIRLSLQKGMHDVTEIVSEHSQNVLSYALAVNFHQLALVYMKHANDQLSIHSLNTGDKLYDIPLPDLGTVSVRADRDKDFLMYRFSSFLYAGTVYYVDLTLPLDDGTRVFRKMDPPGFDPSKYMTKQVFYTSKDGHTKVPMFVVGPRQEMESSTPTKKPCLLYGYGGFMISLTPYYSTRWASWMKCLGGYVAVANIRGGDEYGAEWHNQGILDKKQNVFDDFQWAAKYLCDEMHITTPQSLMIMGGSNGGLLVGACINQAPQLYGAAVAQVGVHDILRFHKFTIGSAWVSDFGDPDKKEDFIHQIKYSPLHNVFSPDEKGVSYPSVLLTTGDHDDRVVPLHTLKYGATLQYKAGASKLQEGKPLLIRIDVKAGHGAGKPTSKVVAELVDTLLFAALALKADLPSST